MIGTTTCRPLPLNALAGIEVEGDPVGAVDTGAHCVPGMEFDDIQLRRFSKTGR
jgi:hypothetical protein